jgi:hypothetical protein
MLKFLRKIRKGFRTACLAAALTTCWQLGREANAAINPLLNEGDEVTLRFSGTVSPTTNNISRLFLIYETGTSSWGHFNLINLGDFIAGQSSSFSVLGNGYYYPEFSWYVAGLYGDITGDKYIEGTNGVVLGIYAQVGDLWNSHSEYDESWIFSQLLNDKPSGYQYYVNYSRHGDYESYLEVSESSVLFDFSNASNNGNMQFQSEIIPEPISIVLLGGGGMIVVAFRRQKK